MKPTGNSDPDLPSYANPKPLMHRCNITQAKETGGRHSETPLHCGIHVVYPIFFFVLCYTFHCVALCTGATEKVFIDDICV